MNKNKIILVVFCFLSVLFLLLLSYKMIVFSTDFTPAQQAWMDYFDEQGKLPANHTTNEISHMENVKKTREFVDYLFYGLLLGITLILTYYKKEIKKIKKLLQYGGITTIIALLVLLFFSFSSFNHLFALFHKVFFPQGNWLFPADSLLIQTFPIDLFIHLSTKIILLSLLLGILFIVVSYLLKDDNS